MRIEVFRVSDSDLESFVCLSKNKSSLYVDAIPSMDLVDRCHHTQTETSIGRVQPKMTSHGHNEQTLV